MEDTTPMVQSQPILSSFDLRMQRKKEQMRMTEKKREKAKEKLALEGGIPGKV